MLGATSVRDGGGVTLCRGPRSTGNQPVGTDSTITYCPSVAPTPRRVGMNTSITGPSTVRNPGPGRRPDTTSSSITSSTEVSRPCVLRRGRPTAAGGGTVPRSFRTERPGAAGTTGDASASSGGTGVVSRTNFTIVFRGAPARGTGRRATSSLVTAPRASTTGQVVTISSVRRAGTGPCISP